MISQQALKEFKEIWKEEHGNDISDELIIKIGGGLIEGKHLEKWFKRLKIKENMDMLRSLSVEQ